MVPMFAIALFVLACIFWLVSLMPNLFFSPAIKFWRWLKGSRTSYLSVENSINGVLVSTLGFFRTNGQISSYNKYAISRVRGSSIEINHGLFRRRSAIYGDAACNWYIKKTLNGLIYLHSRIPMRPDQVLQIINTSLSVHDLYRDQSERITKLEQEIRKLQEKIAWTESHRKTWLATLEALRQEIESDRQKYRSQAAQKIRIRVEQVLEHAKGLDQKPDEDSVDAIKRLWIVRDGGTPPLRRLPGQVWGY